MSESTLPVVQAVGSDDLSGLTYYDISCSLGDIRLYLPVGLDQDSFQVIDGQLINVTNSTIYPYCPEYPDYTWSASRWSPVTYRTNTSYGTTVELVNVDITKQVNPLNWSTAIFLFALLLAGIGALLRGFARRG